MALEAITSNDISFIMNTGLGVGLAIILVRWITGDLIKQMEKNNDALVNKLADLIDCFNKHDDQAKIIKETGFRVETKLDARPCLMKN